LECGGGIASGAGAGAIIVALFTAGVPFGWRVLSAITPDMFLFLSLAGWIIYFAVKLGISFFIGIIAMPFYIYKAVKGLKDAQELDEYINQ